MTTGTAPAVAAADVRDRRRRLKAEGAYAAEIAAICGFVVVRPVLGSFGDSPETFIARGGDGREVVVFGLAVVLIPILVVSAPAAAARLLGDRARRGAHLGALGALGFLGFVQVLRIHTELDKWLLWVPAGVLAAALALLRIRFAATATFLRYAGVASLVFLGQFLFLSPAASLMFGGRSAEIDPEVTAAVAEAVGDDGPPVVVIMLDALPTASLMDGEGAIDAEVYPNLAALADDATWYRNHTTVAPVTLWALPAFLTGVVPAGDDTAPVASAYPRNLFTLLGGMYDVVAEEQITALCPRSLCPSGAGGIGPLLTDAHSLWRKSFTRAHAAELVPGAFDDRYEGFEAWVDRQDFAPGRADAPGLFFYHLLLPHYGWEYLPGGGDRYRADHPPHGSFRNRWGPVGAEVGAQRQILQTQAVDELLGRMFDRMRDAGTYDDALIVVTADHGAAFEADAPLRAMAESQFEQIMWTPLIVKSPGQDDGMVVDADVSSIDVLPLIAAELGVDLGALGWELDGTVPDPTDHDCAPEKEILDWPHNELRAPGGEGVVVVDGCEGLARVLRADMIEGTGPDAPWRRTEYGDLVGEEVDRFRQGEPPAVEIELRALDRFDDVDLDRRLPLEVHGTSWVPADDVVAVVLNGRVAAVFHPEPTPYGVTSVHGLLWPDALVDGENDVAAYQLTGPVDDPAFHRLELVDDL